MGFQRYPSVTSPLLIISLLSILLPFTIGAQIYGTIFVEKYDLSALKVSLEAPECDSVYPRSFYLSEPSVGSLVHFSHDDSLKTQVDHCLDTLNISATYFSNSDYEQIALCWVDTGLFTAGASPLCPQRPGRACSIPNKPHCFNELPCTESTATPNTYFCASPPFPDVWIKEQISAYGEPKEIITFTPYWIQWQQANPPQFEGCDLDYSITDAFYTPQMFLVPVASFVTYTGITQDPDKCVESKLQHFNNLIASYNANTTITDKAQLEALVSLVPFQPECFNSNDHTMNDPNSDCLDRTLLDKCDFDNTLAGCDCESPIGPNCPTRCDVDFTLDGCRCEDQTIPGCPCEDQTSPGCPCDVDPMAEGCRCNLQPMAEDCPCVADWTQPRCPCEDTTKKGCPCENQKLPGCPCEDPQGLQCPTRCVADPTIQGCPCENSDLEACTCYVTPMAEGCRCNLNPMEEGCPCLEDPTQSGCPCAEDPKAIDCPTRCTADPTLDGCEDVDPCVINPNSQECRDTLIEDDSNNTYDIYCKGLVYFVVGFVTCGVMM